MMILCLEVLMTEEKKENLKTKGFQIGSINEFLKLSPEQQKLIENVIIRNGKPIEFCNCLGKGKETCKGNGWIRDGAGFQKCPYFELFDYE